MHPAIKLRHLRLFLAVAEGGTLSAAAQSLGLSQPALSKSLAETEALLGAKLFQRQGRRLAVTAQGEAFRRLVRQALAGLDAAAEVFAPAAERGTIRVGVLPTVSSRFFPEVAARFMTGLPGVTLAIETGPHDYLLQRLRAHQIDLMVGRMPEAAERAGLAFEFLYEEPVVLVARRDHPFARAPIDQVLRRSALILPARDAIIRRMVEDYLAARDLAGLRPAVETSTLALGRGLLLTADAVWFISRGVVANELASGALITIPHGASYLAGAVGFARLQGASPGPALAVLLEMLRAAGQSWDDGTKADPAG